MMTSSEAVRVATELVSAALPTPGDWRWKIRDDGSRLFLEIVSPRYSSALTVTDVAVRAYDYYSVFQDQTSPVITGDPYGSAINELKYSLAFRLNNIQNALLGKIDVAENNIDLDELRRQRAIADDAKRRAEEAEREKAAAEEAERRKREQEVLAGPVCCVLAVVGGAAPSPAPVFEPPTTTDHVVVLGPEIVAPQWGSGIVPPPIVPVTPEVPITPVILREPVMGLAEAKEEVAQVNPLLILGLLLLLILLAYLWS